MKVDVYTIAHEVKNPLCVVKGYLEMLNVNNLEKYKEIIKNELDNSLEILDNYLNYNKIYINKEEIDINVLIMDIKKNMFDYLKKKGIFLKTSLLKDEIYLQADYDKLKQVFHNIIKNSIESQSKKIEISYQVDFDSITIQIKNDGLKLSSDELYRIGTNYTSKISGNGIGLNISKKIINMHGGKIYYKNNIDKGISTFITLTL